MRVGRSDNHPANCRLISIPMSVMREAGIDYEPELEGRWVITSESKLMLEVRERKVIKTETLNGATTTVAVGETANV